MGKLRRCPDCESDVVLTSSGGVHRTILCIDCNEAMEYVERVETEYVRPVGGERLVEGET